METIFEPTTHALGDPTPTYLELGQSLQATPLTCPDASIVAGGHEDLNVQFLEWTRVSDGSSSSDFDLFGEGFTPAVPGGIPKLTATSIDADEYIFYYQVGIGGLESVTELQTRNINSVQISIVPP